MAIYLSSNTLITGGLEVVKGTPPPVLDIIMGAEGTTAEVKADSTTVPYINPNFGADAVYPTNKSIGVTIKTLAAGRNTTTTLDIDNLLFSSGFVPELDLHLLEVNEDYPKSMSGGAGDTVTISAKNYTVAGVFKNTLVVKGATAPGVGDAVEIDGIPRTITKINTTDNADGMLARRLTSDLNDHKTMSIGFYTGDIKTLIASTVFGMSWELKELPMLTFEGSGQYASPSTEAQPSLGAVNCDAPILIEDLQLRIDNTLVSDATCVFDASLDTKGQINPLKSLTSGCTGSVISNAAPTFTIKVAKADLAEFNPVSLWELGERFNISYRFGSGLSTKNYGILINRAGFASPPAQEEIDKVLYYSLEFNVLKPCGGDLNNLTIINF